LLSLRQQLEIKRFEIGRYCPQCSPEFLNQPPPIHECDTLPLTLLYHQYKRWRSWQSRASNPAVRWLAPEPRDR